jgi:alpha-galactosidase
MRNRKQIGPCAASIAVAIISMAAVAAKSGPPANQDPDKPRINGSLIYGARPGHPFLYRIPATGRRPMQFLATGLPQGLRLDRATGIITGAVKAPGTTTVLLKAKNSVGTCERKFRIVIGNQLALTPPMGWSSWYIFQASMNDRDIRAQADAMISSGLADHGYSYIDIDEGWNIKPSKAPGSTPQRDAQGTLHTSDRFPDMKALTDYVHKKGLKAGIYSSPGPLDCGGYAGSYGHEQQDAKLFATWGFDLLKYDKCSYPAKDNSPAEQQKPYRLMGAILAGLDRDFIFNLCQYGDGEVWSWAREVGGHFWRTTGDLGWGPRGVYSLWDNIARDLDKPRDIANWAGPGGWNDPDNVLIGTIAYGPSDDLQPSADLRYMPAPLTPDEQYTYMSLWSLQAAPLILGSDLTKLDSFTLSLLTNDEVIAVDQDPLGKQATRVFNAGGLSVWAKDLEDGSKAVGLFNLGDRETKVVARWDDLRISGKRLVRDLWRQKDVGGFEREFQARVAPHGVVLVRISEQGK